jgi:hypothetical protein
VLVVRCLKGAHSVLGFCQQPLPLGLADDLQCAAGQQTPGQRMQQPAECSRCGKGPATAASTAGARGSGR